MKISQVDESQNQAVLNIEVEPEELEEPPEELPELPLEEREDESEELPPEDESPLQLDEDCCD